MKPRPAPVTEMMVALYLDGNERARWTLHTWLHYTLMGKAKNEGYWGYYERMRRILTQREAQGRVRRVPSAKGGVAWVRA